MRRTKERGKNKEAENLLEGETTTWEGESFSSSSETCSKRKTTQGHVNVPITIGFGDRNTVIARVPFIHRRHANIARGRETDRSITVTRRFASKRLHSITFSLRIVFESLEKPSRRRAAKPNEYLYFGYFLDASQIPRKKQDCPATVFRRLGNSVVCSSLRATPCFNRRASIAVLESPCGRFRLIRSNFHRREFRRYPEETREISRWNLDLLYLVRFDYPEGEIPNRFGGIIIFVASCEYSGGARKTVDTPE